MENLNVSVFSQVLNGIQKVIKYEDQVENQFPTRKC